jgi:hypothetical protein
MLRSVFLHPGLVLFCLAVVVVGLIASKAIVRRSFH